MIRIRTLIFCLSATEALGFSGELFQNLPPLHEIQNAARTLPQVAPQASWMEHASSVITSSNDIGADIADFIGPKYASYCESLKTNPLETKVATGVVLAIVGDAIAQAREPEPYDKKRATAFVAFDGTYRAVQQWTYPPLMKACQGQYLTALAATVGIDTSSFSDQIVSLTAAFEQTLVSQLGIIPLFYYPVFYAVTGTVQGLTLEQTIQRAKDTFIPLMKRNLMFWIPVQFGVFGFVEESLQIPLLIVCGLVWTVILSISAGAVKAASTVEDPLLEEEIVLAMDSSNSKSATGFFNNPVNAKLDDSTIGTSKIVNGTLAEVSI